MATWGTTIVGNLYIHTCISIYVQYVQYVHILIDMNMMICMSYIDPNGSPLEVQDTPEKSTAWNQVYGAEWSYGVYGVACDPPRAETAHVYECSVFVGSTAARPK